jgi:autotransporter-associated beta strand protein
MGNVFLGWNASATLNMNGGIMTVLGSIYHTDSTDGSAINLNGGALEANRIGTDSGNGTFLVNFNGGTLREISDTLLSDTQKKSYMPLLQVQNGGAVIDSNGRNIEATQAFLKNGSGGLTKQGAGTLTFSGGTYTGVTTVTAGTLNLNFNKRATGAASGAFGELYNRASRLVLNGGNFAVTGRSAAAGLTRNFTVGTTLYTLVHAITTPAIWSRA